MRSLGYNFQNGRMNPTAWCYEHTSPGLLGEIKDLLAARRGQADMAIRYVAERKAIRKKYDELSPSTETTPEKEALSRLRIDACIVNMGNEAHRMGPAIRNAWNLTYHPTGGLSDEGEATKFARFSTINAVDWEILKFWIRDQPGSVYTPPVDPRKPNRGDHLFLVIRLPDESFRIWLDLKFGPTKMTQGYLKYMGAPKSQRDSYFWRANFTMKILGKMPDFVATLPASSRSKIPH